MNLELRYYLSIFLRRFHYFLIVALLVSGIGVTVAAVLPTVYTATARILVEGEQIPGSLASSTVRTGARAQIDLIEQRLTARTRILGLANDLDIYDNRSGLNPDTIVADLRRRISISYSSRRNGADILLVGFSSDDPQQAAEVANQLATIILDESVEARTGQASQTLDFFEAEARRISEEMNAISQKILNFKTENRNALPENLEFRLNRQTALQERLIQLQRREADLVERRADLVQRFEENGRITAPVEMMSENERQLQSLRKELDQALLVYSDINPRVRVLQARIAALETEVANEQAGGDPDNGAPSAYEVQLADIDTQIEQIKEERQSVNAELASLQETIEATPINGIRLGDLTREQNNLQRQYEQIVSSQATAAMGERIEVLSKGQRYTLLEQAVPPNAPSSPSRPLIAGAGLGAGLAGGLVLVILLELFNTSIRRPIEIERKLQITPIGTLPYIRTHREALVRRVLMLIGFGVVGIGIPAVIVAVHFYYMPLDVLIDRIADKAGLSALFSSL